MLVWVSVAVKYVAVGVGGGSGRLRRKFTSMLIKIRIEIPRMTTIMGKAGLRGGGLPVMF